MQSVYTCVGGHACKYAGAMPRASASQAKLLADNEGVNTRTKCCDSETIEKSLAAVLTRGSSVGDFIAFVHGEAISLICIEP